MLAALRKNSSRQSSPSLLSVDEDDRQANKLPASVVQDAVPKIARQDLPGLSQGLHDMCNAGMMSKFLSKYLIDSMQYMSDTIQGTGKGLMSLGVKRNAQPEYYPEPPVSVLQACIWDLDSSSKAGQCRRCQTPHGLD